MKRLLWGVLCLSFLLTGCELLFQAGTGLSGQAREDYIKSIKAYGAYWVKPGMTTESWRQDWVEYLGHVAGLHVIDADGTLLVTAGRGLQLLERGAA